MCSLNFEKISLLIIAGGKSSRLGTDKRFVEIGGISLLENILKKSARQNFSEILLCVECNSLHINRIAEKYNAKIIVDEIQNSGALSGIANGLKHAKNDWSLAISCDIPFLEFDILKSFTLSEASAVIPITGEKKQLLCAFYHKSASEIFFDELKHNQRKILTAVEKISHQFVEISNCESYFFNVNTPADLRLAQGRFENLSRQIPMISITAPCSGTGKTTFIEKVTKKLTAEGFKIGVIKSDSHGFNVDIEGKDSKIFQNAGAKSVAVVAPTGFFLIQKTDERESFLKIAEKFDDVDLILTESRTHGIFPVLSLWRGFGEVIQNENVAAIFSITPEKSSDIFQADLNDIETATGLILFLAGF